VKGIYPSKKSKKSQCLVCFAKCECPAVDNERDLSILKKKIIDLVCFLNKVTCRERLRTDVRTFIPFTQEKIQKKITWRGLLRTDVRTHIPFTQWPSTIHNKLHPVQNRSLPNGPDALHYNLCRGLIHYTRATAGPPACQARTRLRDASRGWGTGAEWTATPSETLLGTDLRTCLKGRIRSRV
jgi:hypothetical protein